ncbi:putative membrane protein YqhA [Paucimonas lemoignei]|uniref:Putative membrane protein YqhA n=1 Tax=Paucimonas lemoignei TaxID=29443 RepID=A0A4R3HXX2_PAULE|nr:YqhA family protein [Paucimonas lemoignei]TCS38028.1 putative membrane protein YqhA [Paucimonas lemoignei]
MNEHERDSTKKRIDRFSQVIGHTRFIVLLAVTAVMLVAVSLFLLGALQAVFGIWDAWRTVLNGDLHATQLTIRFLEIVSVMLKAVVFYLIGVGLYSLFVSPLNITVSLGVQTLADLESKVISVVVVIMSVTFLEHFVGWSHPKETLEFGGSLALVVVALVLFQRFNQLAKKDQQIHSPDAQEKAQTRMFERQDEQANVTGAAKTTDDKS